MAVFESVTRRTVRSLIAQRIRDFLVEGTATSGSSTTLIDTNNLLAASDDDYIGGWVFIHTGTGLGQERAITDSTASTKAITVPTWTTTPDSTSQYEIHRRHRVNDYNRAIDAALRASRFMHLSHYRLAQHLTNTSLLNPLFTHWSNGTTSAPDDWSLVTAGLRQTLSTFVHAGESYSVSAVVASTSALTRLSVYDGTTTTTDNHEGSGGWELLEIESTASSTSSSIRVDLEIDTTGSATIARESTHRLRGPYAAAITRNSLSAYVDSVYVSTPRHVLEYPLSTAPPHTIHRVSIDAASPSSNPEMFIGEYEVPQKYWFATSGNTNPSTILGFRSEYFIAGRNTPLDLMYANRSVLPSNRVITLEGLTYPTMPTADTSTFDINVEAVVNYAASVLLREEGRTDEANAAFSIYNAISSNVRPHYPKNSRIIFPV